MKDKFVLNSNVTNNNSVVKFDPASVARMAGLTASDARDQFRILTKRLELADIKASKMLKHNRRYPRIE